MYPTGFKNTVLDNKEKGSERNCYDFELETKLDLKYCRVCELDLENISEFKGGHVAFVLPCIYGKEKFEE